MSECVSPCRDTARRHQPAGLTLACCWAGSSCACSIRRSHPALVAPTFCCGRPIAPYWRNLMPVFVVIVISVVGGIVGWFIGETRGRPVAGMVLGGLFGILGWITVRLLDPTFEHRFHTELALRRAMDAQLRPTRNRTPPTPVRSLSWSVHRWALSTDSAPRRHLLRRIEQRCCAGQSDRGDFVPHRRHRRRDRPADRRCRADALAACPFGAPSGRRVERPLGAWPRAQST
jgi:uncharacterized membrane protein (UPF0136 family)